MCVETNVVSLACHGVLWELVGLPLRFIIEIKFTDFGVCFVISCAALIRTQIYKPANKYACSYKL